MEPLALLAEAGDEGGLRQLRHLADPAQPEPGQASPNVEIRAEERRRQRSEEPGVVAGLHGP
jgi:hypothetical protein